MINFTPFPILSTERLDLHQIRMEDENEIFFLRSDDRMLKYLGHPKAESLDEIRNYIERINNGISNNESILWGMYYKNSTKLIGTICLWNLSEDKTTADIGYILHPDNQGSGLMQEAVEKIIDYGFEVMKLKIIEAEVTPDNMKSIALLNRNGFIYSKTLDDTVIYLLKNKLV